MKKLLTIIISLTIAGLAATLLVLSLASNYNKIHLSVQDSDTLTFIPKLELNQNNPELMTDLKVNLDDIDSVVINYPNFYSTTLKAHYYYTDNVEYNTLNMSYYGDYNLEDGVLTLNIQEVPISGNYNISLGVDSSNKGKEYSTLDDLEIYITQAKDYNSGKITSTSINNIFEGGFNVD